jgi:hypothetical protein
MEKIKENLDKENNLEFYRNQFIEITKKQSDPHFEKINPGDLTGEDLLIFKDFLENKLTFEKFKEYQYGFRNFREEEADKISSYWFMAWLGNKMMIRQLEQIK